MAENYERKIYDVVAKGYKSAPSQFEGGINVEHSGESLFPQRPAAPSKGKAGSTGATGPAPQPPPIPRSPFSSNPILQNALNQHFNTPGNTWYDRAANQANAATEQFGSDSPTLVNYHWVAGTGGVMGGNNSVIEKMYSDGSRTIGPGGSQYNMFGDPLVTTRDKQNEILGATVNANANAVGGVSPTAGFIPPWNSPTGNAIDTRTMTETPFTAGLTPPSNWLKSAIIAARSGASTYDTGGLKSEGNSPQGGIVPHNPQGFYIGTPSGGTIGMLGVKASLEGVDTLGAGLRTAENDRSNLYNAIEKAHTTPGAAAPTTQSMLERSQLLANRNQNPDLYGGG